MLYFSELSGIKIYSDEGKQIGVLDDLIFSVTDIPYIRKLVVSRSFRIPFLPFNIRIEGKKIIPIDYLQKLDSKKIILEKAFKKTDIEENELYVRKNLLDTQVIDIEENNIVRVNDVLIRDINSHWLTIYGVDIGVAGILRWFKIEKLLNRFLRMFDRSYIPASILAWSDIQPLELTRGRVLVRSRFDKLKKLHPADLADYLETQNFKNAMTLIEGIDKEYLGEVISELNPNFQLDLLKMMPVDKIALIVSVMDSDDAADLISQFSEKQQETIFKKIPEDEANKIRKLLKLSKTKLGEFLSTEFFTVNPDYTVTNVMKDIKNYTSDYSTLEYIYVVNKEEQLVGVFSPHQLLLQSWDTLVFKFMTQRLITVNLNTPVEIALRRMSKYKIPSLPVVDKKKRIIGIVLIEDLIKENIEKSD